MEDNHYDFRKQVTVDAFKSFAYLVFEVSKDEKITNVWGKDSETETWGRERYLDLKVEEINNDNVIHLGKECVTIVFETGEPQLIEYTTQTGSRPFRYFIRISRAPYNEALALVIIEKKESDTVREIVEDKWYLALDASGDGIWDINLETNGIFFSDRWHKMFGYSKGEILTLEQWTGKIHPDDLEIVSENWKNYFDGNTPAYSNEMRYLCKDGSYKWILSRGMVLSYDGDKRPKRFIGTHKDIHEIKTQQILLSQSKKSYQTLFEYSVAVICTHDLDGNILNINPYTAELLQYAPEELIGNNIADFVPDRFKEDVATGYLNTIKEKLTAEGVISLITKTGALKHLLYKNYLFSSPNDNDYIIAFAQDITERMKAEAELRASEEMFSTYFNFSGIGMAIVSPAGKWERINSAFCKMIGYPKRELYRLSFSDITHPDDREHGILAFEKMLQKEIDAYDVEKRYITKNGKIIWVSLTTSLFRDAQDKPRFFVSQFVDVTAKKELTNQLQRKNEELKSAQKELLNKVKELEEMSHAIAHNLRGPSKNINLLTKVLNIKCGKTYDNEDAHALADSFSLEELAALIDSVGVSMSNSLETLLNIAEIRLNKELPFDECNFAETINTVTEQLVGDILRKNIDVEVDLPVEKIYYPKPYLESILYNLISNAIKYSNPDTESRIWIQTTMNDRGETVLSVKDNGFGIDMKKYGNKIFRLNQVFHKSHDSKGVGLYLTKTQIESLGGKILVDSRVNEGATFTVIFKHAV